MIVFSFMHPKKLGYLILSYHLEIPCLYFMRIIFLYKMESRAQIYYSVLLNVFYHLNIFLFHNYSGRNIEA
jgi:hypothetical protein